jgi:hypothetical protein
MPSSSGKTVPIIPAWPIIIIPGHSAQNTLADQLIAFRRHAIKVVSLRSGAGTRQRVIRTSQWPVTNQGSEIKLRIVPTELKLTASIPINHPGHNN